MSWFWGQCLFPVWRPETYRIITYPSLNASSLKLCKTYNVLGGKKQEHATAFNCSLQTNVLERLSPVKTYRRDTCWKIRDYTIYLLYACLAVRQNIIAKVLIFKLNTKVAYWMPCPWESVALKSETTSFHLVPEYIHSFLHIAFKTKPKQNTNNNTKWKNKGNARKCHWWKLCCSYGLICTEVKDRRMIKTKFEHCISTLWKSEESN